MLDEPWQQQLHPGYVPPYPSPPLYYTYCLKAITVLPPSTLLCTRSAHDHTEVYTRSVHDHTDVYTRSAHDHTDLYTRSAHDHTVSVL